MTITPGDGGGVGTPCRHSARECAASLLPGPPRRVLLWKCRGEAKLAQREAVCLALRLLRLLPGHPARKLNRAEWHSAEACGLGGALGGRPASSWGSVSPLRLDSTSWGMRGGICAACDGDSPGRLGGTPGTTASLGHG